VPEDARELLRLAQEAERSGDLARAESLLEQAAAAVDRAGHGERAARLRRHARRLAETLPGETGQALTERFPVLADPAAAAWCSFCCQPDREVGRLVAGAAGAFICAGCLQRAEALLGPSGSEGAG
jgi:ClpX C4-type zinc finger